MKKLNNLYHIIVILVSRSASRIFYRSSKRDSGQSQNDEHHNKSVNFQSGIALITLLFFTIIGISVFTAAALIVTTNILSSSNSEKSIKAYYAAESGIENGILYVLSHPTYNGPDLTITTTDGDATISFVYDSIAKTDTITSTGTYLNTIRKIRAVASYANGSFSVSPWEEIP